MQDVSLTDLEWIEAYANTGDSQDFRSRQLKRFVARVCGSRLQRLAEKTRGSIDLREGALAITFGVLSDEPARLAHEMTAWIDWLISRGIIGNASLGALEEQALKENLVEALEREGYARKDLARRLLEDGFSPEELGGQEALDYLSGAGFDPGYVREFLLPPPDVMWKGGLFHPPSEDEL
jgi:hypothetical protein